MEVGLVSRVRLALIQKDGRIATIFEACSEAPSKLGSVQFEPLVVGVSELTVDFNQQF